MISAEAPVLFAKACELFIMDLTTRSWFHAEENKRRTLKKDDIAAAITRTDIFDFLVDVVPRDETKEEATGLVPGMLGYTASGVHYYYSPMAQPGVMMGRPAMPGVNSSVYVQPEIQASSNSNLTIPNLPPELVSEILSRLPLKIMFVADPVLGGTVEAISY